MWRKIKNFYHLLMAVASCVYYRFPAKKLKVIGVTGTDGKTTTAHLIYQILKTAGRKVSLISSIKAEIVGKQYETGFHVTTPNPWFLQKFLRKAVDKGAGYIVLETTSHALDQHRVFGISFEVGVLTNVTREHLDYHKTYENYLTTKVKLLQRAKWAVVNRNDESYKKLKVKSDPFDKTQGHPDLSAMSSRPNGQSRTDEKLKVVTYGIEDGADVVAIGVSLSPTRSEFIYQCMDTYKRGEERGVNIRTKLLGEYNVYNSLAAIGCGRILGISDEIIKKALANFKSPEGRMEFVDKGQPFSIIIDFAHTPNALEKTLTTLRTLYPVNSDLRSEHGALRPKPYPPKRGAAPSGLCALNPKFILVFGCAGLRDKQKRPVMGEIAAKLADLIVLTAEDPRTEDVNDIIDQIAEGCKKAGGAERNLNHSTIQPFNHSFFFRVPDRQKAINFAIQKLAQKGDIVLITGKGHEKSMCFGKTEHPWSDKKAVLKALKKWLMIND